MSNNIHTTTAPSSIDANLQTYYDKRLMENAYPAMVHYQLGSKAQLPKNSGNVFQFRRFGNLEADTTALTEGVVPDGQSLSVSMVPATVKGYGQYVACSDLLSLTSVDKFINGAAKELGETGGLTIDTVVRDTIAAGTNVQYAATATARNQITAAMKLTVDDIRKAVRTLKRANAPRFVRGGREYYVAVVGPDATFDLQGDSKWVDASKYAAAEQLLSGELGRLYGVIFVESSNAVKFEDAGASSADVHATLVVGRNAFGVVDVTGDSNPNKIKTIIKNRGSAGTSDPLDQISTVGWKVDAFACAILRNDWMVRIEHGVTA